MYKIILFLNIGVETRVQHYRRRQCRGSLIPISILGQPTKDDVAKGKEGERGRGKNMNGRADSYLGL